MHKIVYAGLGAAMCVACSVGEDYARPEFYKDKEIAREIGAVSSASLPQKWYADCEDEQLTLLIERGLQNNTDIKTSISRLKQARAQLQITKVAALPQIDLQGGYNYEKSGKNISPAADSHYYNAGFDASWEIDLWGKNRRQIEAGKANLSAAKYTLKNIRLVVAAEIAANYINLSESVENLRLSEKNYHLQQEIFATVKAKYENGLTDESAYNQAHYLLENTQAQITTYRAAVEQYHNALATIIGVLPSELNVRTTSAAKLSAPPRKKSRELAEFTADVVRFRPDVAAAEQNLIAENAAVGAAVAELYPAVSISGLWGYAAEKGGKLLRASSETYSYAPLVSLPLLDWNRLQNNVRIQKYIKEEALENYKQTLLAAVSEIKNAQTAYYEALQSMQHRYNALVNMRKVAQLTQRKYESGLTEFYVLAEAQQDLVAAEQAYVAARALILQKKTAFYKAIGAPV